MNAMPVKFLGSTDEVTTCDHCGRCDLKCTIALDIQGEVVYYGTTCASKALAGRGVKMSAATIKRNSERVDLERLKAAHEAKRQAEGTKWAAWLQQTTGETDVFRGIQALGGYMKAHDRYVSETQNGN